MGMFKRAAARGIANELARTGVVSFPTKQAMDEIADQAADSMPSMPELPAGGPEAPPAEADTAALVQQIIALAEQLKAAQGGGMGGGMGGAGGPMSGAEAVQKEAAATDIETLASQAAIACMDKAAAETGTLAGQGNSDNKPASATKNDSVAALDEKQRPEGTYNEGVGKTQLDTSAGQIGASKAPTVQPNASPSGENSVTTGTKSAEALREAVLKQASTLIGVGGQKGNTMEQSAKNDPVAALDLKNRPLGKYMVPPGGANFSESQAARVGVEKKVTDGVNNSPGGSNSVTEASKAASEEEKAFTLLFQKTAADVGQYLPDGLSDDEKIAAVSAMMGLGTEGRQAYLTALHEKSAAAKKAKTPTEPAAPSTGTSVLAGVRAALK
jgi:hypothetical protein